MDDLIKILISYGIPFVILVIQLIVAVKLSPVDKKIGILCEIVSNLKQSINEVKEDTEKQWEELTQLRSAFDRLYGEHLINHKR